MTASNASSTVTMRCRGVWEEGMRTRLEIRRYDSLIADEPEALGGTDQGPNPLEYLMGALDSCVAVMIGIVGGEIGFQHEGIELIADGDLDLRGLMGDPSVAHHFTEIRIKVRLGTAESAERVELLKEKVESRCPMLHLFRAAGVPVVSTWEMV